MVGRGSLGPLLHQPLPRGSNSGLGRMQIRAPAPAGVRKEAKLIPRQGGSGGFCEQAGAWAAKVGLGGAGCMSDMHLGAFGPPEC